VPKTNAGEWEKMETEKLKSIFFLEYFLKSEYFFDKFSSFPSTSNTLQIEPSF